MIQGRIWGPPTLPFQGSPPSPPPQFCCVCPSPPGDDSWDLITCYCQKPFAGRPMIECSQCGTWIHLSCAKVKKNNVPDVFYCQKCREGPRRAPPAAPRPGGDA